MKNNNAKPSIVTYGMWQLPYKAVNVLCPDGKRRNCKLASQPDTYYSIRASVSYRGKTVTGYVTSTNDPVYDLFFYPVTYGKNGALFDGNPFRDNPFYVQVGTSIAGLYRLYNSQWEQYSTVTADDIKAWDNALSEYITKHVDEFSNVKMLRNLCSLYFPPNSATCDLLRSLIVKHTPKG